MNFHHNDKNLESSVKLNISDEINNSDLTTSINIMSKIIHNICELQKLTINVNPELASVVRNEPKRIKIELIQNRDLLLKYLNKIIIDLSFETVSKQVISKNIYSNIKSVETDSIKGLKVTPL